MLSMLGYASTKADTLMKDSLESTDSTVENPTEGQPPGWLKLGIVAAASALAGGVAAAWWYKKTLTKLRQAEIGVPDSEFRASEEDSSEEG